jgi:hypothetical protein
VTSRKEQNKWTNEFDQREMEDITNLTRPNVDRVVQIKGMGDFCHFSIHGIVIGEE